MRRAHSRYAGTISAEPRCLCMKMPPEQEKVERPVGRSIDGLELAEVGHLVLGHALVVDAHDVGMPHGHADVAFLLFDTRPRSGFGGCIARRVLSRPDGCQKLVRVVPRAAYSLPLRPLSLLD